MTVKKPIIQPRGLNRVQAAMYVGVSVGIFDVMVEDGRMPKPRIVNTRQIYDLHELDEHFDSLPYLDKFSDSDEGEGDDENAFDTVPEI